MNHGEEIHYYCVDIVFIMLSNAKYRMEYDVVLSLKYIGTSYTTFHIWLLENMFWVSLQWYYFCLTLEYRLIEK